MPSRWQAQRSLRNAGTHQRKPSSERANLRIAAIRRRGEEERSAAKPPAPHTHSPYGFSSEPPLAVLPPS